MVVALRNYKAQDVKGGLGRAVSSRVNQPEPAPDGTSFQ
jgi:hypothetical protein